LPPAPSPADHISTRDDRTPEGDSQFELGWKWGDPVTHANVCRDSISLDLIAVPNGKQGTAMVYIQVKGVDAYYSELNGRNVRSSNLDDRPYGLRDFEVVDPSGNRLAFGEPREG
jgi:uncharacterized glyoxalase superfamily protein PhnB